MMTRVAIFASGSGSNAEEIIKYFRNNPSVIVDSVYTNNPQAGVISRCNRLGIDCISFTRENLNNGILEKQLDDRKTDFIVLAGFLLKLPAAIVRKYPNRILNIHPALLPKFGGKGMYGDHVHRAVLEAGEKESGITIHLVNENYDEGKIIFQRSLAVLPGDTVESLAERIHKLEHTHYPKVIKEYITSLT